MESSERKTQSQNNGLHTYKDGFRYIVQEIQKYFLTNTKDLLYTSWEVKRNLVFYAGLISLMQMKSGSRKGKANASGRVRWKELFEWC